MDPSGDKNVNDDVLVPIMLQLWPADCSSLSSLIDQIRSPAGGT